jgi:hypothetical protein
MACVVPNCDGDIQRLNKLCRACYNSWVRMRTTIGETSGVEWENWLIKRSKHKLMPEKYANSPFAKIPLDDRVITRKGGVRVNGTHICRGCQKDVFIVNPTYHICSSCTALYQYLGESCDICSCISDGINQMMWNPNHHILNCGNCKGKLRKYGLTPQKLQQYLSVENCPLCDCVLTEGRAAKGRTIDHDHNCCSYDRHRGPKKICGNCVRGVICTSCNKAEGHIAKISDDYMQWSTMLLKYLKKEYEWDEIEIIKVEQYDEIKKYRNSKYSIIPEVERVPSKDANEGKTHICRRCNLMKKIRNTSYHFCENCLQKEEFIGEICYCCNYVADGTKIMKKSNQSYMTRSNVPSIFCQDCSQKMMRFRISKYHLAKLLKVTNCEICDLNLSLGKEAVNKDNAINIDHDHKTGRVRGVLCPNCNKAEGYIRNISQDPNIWAEKLQTYLLSREAPEN